MGAARMPPVKPWRWTRARYDEAVRTGVIDEDDPVELLDGLLVVREPQSSRHAAISLLVREALQRAFKRGHHVRDHSPVALDAMSEPDRGRYRYRTVRILRRGASVTALAAPSERIRVAALLP